ncbi:MAG: alpha/beta fold hydrolase, partial [Ramlibacter sp.]
MPFRQQIRFATTSDGVKVAFAESGKGDPLVRAGHWMTHLEWDWQTPVWGPWLEALSARHHLYRYDSRGCGLSDRDIASITLDDLVADLEAVVDAAGLDRFALLGASQGG